jgi:hypothetical protein
MGALLHNLLAVSIGKIKLFFAPEKPRFIGLFAYFSGFAADRPKNYFAARPTASRNSAGGFSRSWPTAKNAYLSPYS